MTEQLKYFISFLLYIKMRHCEVCVSSTAEAQGCQWEINKFLKKIF